MTQVNLEQLTPEQRKALAQEALQAERLVKEEKEVQRAEYKRFVDETVKQSFEYLEAFSEKMSTFKRGMINDLTTLVELKKEAYNEKVDTLEAQQSHSFTTLDGNITITLGQNINDGWDDTVTEGITKVRESISKLASDENTQKLVNTVLRLLSRDEKGNLKASRVLQLKKLAEEYADPNFTDGVDIIAAAYRPTPSSTYIKASYKDKDGVKHHLPLSITNA